MSAVCELGTVFAIEILFVKLVFAACAENDQQKGIRMEHNEKNKKENNQ